MLSVDILPVIANEGERIDIPDGCILENRTLAVLRESFTLAHDDHTHF